MGVLDSEHRARAPLRHISKPPYVPPKMAVQARPSSKASTIGLPLLSHAFVFVVSIFVGPDLPANAW